MNERINVKRIIRIVGIAAISFISILCILGGSFMVWAMNSEPVTDEEEIRDGISSEEYVPADEVVHDYQLYNNIHLLTHQKVHADTKWGSAEITKKRITDLINLLHEKEFSHADYLKAEISKWEGMLTEDFENAVELHNYVWDLMNGTVGKAERLLTEEEEQQYIEEHFE